jgi:hypothetical protein
MRCLAVSLVLLTGAAALAQGGPPSTILVESHAAPRPPQADEFLEAVLEGLGGPRPMHGAELHEIVSERLSRFAGMVDYPLISDVRAAVIDAQEDVAHARFAEAVARVERLRTLVAQQAAAVAADPSVRKALFIGTLALLKSLVRLRRQGEAESLAVELARSFPDFHVTEREHGPEVAEFLARVRQQNWPRATHSITIETNPPGAAVFLNERFVGTSPVRVPNALPGRYRVMARAGAQQSRVHTVDVVEDSVNVRIDLAFDHALGGQGFVFANDAERTRREPAYVLRLARAVGVGEVVTVGLKGSPERPLWAATVYNVDTGGVLRSAAVALSPLAAPRALLVSLGRFLRAGRATEGIIVQLDQGPAVGASPARDAGTRGGGVLLRVLAGVSLAAGAALVGTGGYFVDLDGKGACTLQPGQLRCPSVHRTLAGGAAMLATGGALLVAGTTLLVLDLRRSRLRVGLAPGGGGTPTLAWLAGAF